MSRIIGIPANYEQGRERVVRRVVTRSEPPGNRTERMRSHASMHDPVDGQLDMFESDES